MQKLQRYLANQRLPLRLHRRRHRRQLPQRGLQPRLRLVLRLRKPQSHLPLRAEPKPTHTSALRLSELRKLRQPEALPQLDPMTATSIKDAAVLCGAPLPPF